MKKIREYYEREALLLENHQKEIYLGDPWDRYWHGTRLFQILEIVKPLIFTSLLDVGCAEGYYLKLIADAQSSEELHEVGLDVAKNYLLKAKKRGHRHSWVLGDAHKLPFKNNSFDLVLCSEVLEHLLDPKEAFVEAVRVSGKYVLISVAGENLFYHFAKKLRLVKPKDPFEKVGEGHIHEMKISEIMYQWAPEAGCEHLKTIVTCYFPATFLKKHRMPTFMIPIVKLVNNVVGKLSVIREWGMVQIALLEKN